MVKTVDNMFSNHESKFLISLLLTIFIELIVLFIMIRFFYKVQKSRISTKMLFFTGFICSFATLPYVWFIFPYLFENRIFYILVAELFAVLFESVIIYFLLKLNFAKSLAVSFFCNMISFLIGLSIIH